MAGVVAGEQGALQCNSGSGGDPARGPLSQPLCINHVLHPSLDCRHQGTRQPILAAAGSARKRAWQAVGRRLSCSARHPAAQSPTHHHTTTPHPPTLPADHPAGAGGGGAADRAWDIHRLQERVRHLGARPGLSTMGCKQRAALKAAAVRALVRLTFQPHLKPNPPDSR